MARVLLGAFLGTAPSSTTGTARSARGSLSHAVSASCGECRGEAVDEMAGDRVDVRSAGSVLADRINPVAVQAMAEVGIDIADSDPTTGRTWPSER